MGKSVIINQDKLLMLKETMASNGKVVSHKDICVNEAAPEVDEYEIGGEKNAPIGGVYYHSTNEDNINESVNFDTSEIGGVNYTWDFDEEEYQEWLVDSEYENTQESLMEYINDNVEFELEYLDNETFHECGHDYVDYNTLEDMFGSKMQQEILTTCMNDGSGSFETINLFSDDDVDINDQNSVNNIAMKLLRHGDYFKGCRGFILTNGVVVYTESEHNEICKIPNVNNKFDFIRMGNIRVLSQSIDIGAEPTSEQRDVLRKVIASYSDEELYLDIYQGKSSIGVKYIRPQWRYVMGEIDRYYSEGIKPQGNDFYENKKVKSKILENKYDDLYIKAYNDLQNFTKQCDMKYGNSGWHNESYMKFKHPEIEVDPKDIKIYNALLKKHNEIVRLWNDEDNKEEEDKKSKEPTDYYDVISLAVEKFGLTSSLSQAGYILPNGTLLSLGTDGYRDTDHRAIKGIYKENNIPIWSDEYRYNYVVDFMNHGAIRCDIITGILDMTQEPTSEQYSVIKSFVRKAEDVDIDFTDDKGNTLHSVSYSDARPQQVVADIYKYYNEGIKPQGNIQYESKKNKKSVIISENQLNILKENTFESWFGNSILRDEDGKPLKMYHGTDTEFDVFSKDHIGKTGAYEGYGFNFTPFESRARGYNSINVIEAYLKVENPMTTKSHKITLKKLMKVISELDKGKPFTDTIVAAYEPARYNEKWDAMYYRRALPIAAKTIYDYNKESNYGDAGLYAEICLCGQSDKIETINAFEKLGYDSAIFYNNDGKINTVIVFEPNQIKRTNNKTFSIDSDVMSEQITEGYINKIPQEFIDLAIKFRKNEFTNWCVVDLVDIRRVPRYFEKKEVAVRYMKTLRQFGNKPALINLDAINGINENFNFEVDSSEIDLSSFKKKDELVPSIWDESGKLNSRIRLKLLDIADDFWDFVNLKWVEPKGIILTGSICNFNWSEQSDIDLHIIADFDEIDEKTEFVRDYLDSKKNEWNNEHDALEIMGHKVELYVQNLGEMPKSNGIYDLEENDWSRHPNINDIHPLGLDKFPIKDKAANIMTIIDDMYDALSSTDDSHKIEQMGDDANYLWKKIKELRKNSLEKDGEMGKGNVVYKILRREGYLDKLWKLKTLCYDKTNSISEGKKSKEILKEYLEKDNNLPLYRYFKWASTASSCEKAKDLAYECGYYVERYIDQIHYRYQEFDELLEKYDGKFDYGDDEAIETFCEMLEKNNLCDHFISLMQSIVDYYELPSWCTMYFNRIVKNEWCIHFGSDSENIAREGFTGGTPEIEHLAYTNAGQQKPYAGYDFAFLINDRSVDYNEYGDEAVIFRTSGIEVFHYGDNQNQVVFWGPNVKSFIPIHQEDGDWVVYGQKGQILFRGENPSDVANWATFNLPQYRKQIMTGKNGYIPLTHFWNSETNKYERVPYPIYRNESISKYITLLKNNLINEEFALDGNTEHNPFKERWKAEREALKNYICNYGTVMQSKEDNKGGKLYKVFWDKGISQLIGYNYCLCVQWDEIKLKPKSVVYVRAMDKFTPNIRRNITFDNRGLDNQAGTWDDVRY